MDAMLNGRPRKTSEDLCVVRGMAAGTFVLVVLGTMPTVPFFSSVGLIVAC